MKNKYYCVVSGRQKGIFSSWSKCAELVNGYSNSKFKSFSSFEEAAEYFWEGTGIEISEKQVDKYIYSQIELF